MREETHGNAFGVGLGCLGILAIAFLLVMFSSCKMVPSGERGVKTTWGAVTGDIRDEGIHFIMPFADDLKLMNVRTNAIKATAAAASKDLQVISAEVTLNARLEPSRVATIYQTFRGSIQAVIIEPAIQEAVKANTAKYTAEELITNRESVKTTIEHTLRERLEPNGVVVDTINITNFDFSPEFNAAIEAKVTAEQRARQAENDLERIKIEAEQFVVKATAEADSIRIKSVALKDNPQLIELEAVQHWNGVGPTTVVIAGDSASLPPNFLLNVVR